MPILPVAFPLLACVRMFRRGSCVALMSGMALLSASPEPAVTLDELSNDPRLTPARFARHFSNFKYQFRAEVQAPEVFLATRSGDCDDYATLAASVLRKKGYTPRLIAVRVPGVVHVVCYIEESRSYLDYNNRAFLFKMVSCGGTLPEIADKVARSFRARWTSVSEFTFEEGLKRLVRTEVREEKRVPGSEERALAAAQP